METYGKAKLMSGNSYTSFYRIFIPYIMKTKNLLYVIFRLFGLKFPLEKGERVRIQKRRDSGSSGILFGYGQ